MALDKEQLKHTVETTFGAGTDCNVYLQKFVDFELKLSIGTVNDGFLEKYKDYVALFDESILEPWTEIHDYISALFFDMEIRRQEHIVKKLHTIHRLLFSTSRKKDYSFLCFELLLAVMKEKSTSKSIIPLQYVEGKTSAGDFDRYVLKIDDSIPTRLAAYIKENWNYQIGICQSPYGHYPIYDKAADIPLLLIGYSELTYGEKGLLSHHSEYSKYAEYIDDFKAVKRMLEIIE